MVLTVYVSGVGIIASAGFSTECTYNPVAVATQEVVSHYKTLARTVRLVTSQMIDGSQKSASTYFHRMLIAILSQMDSSIHVLTMSIMDSEEE